MIRSRTLPTLPALLLAAAFLAMIAFGATRWLLAPDATALPALNVAADTAAAAPGALNPSTLYKQRAQTVVAIDSTINGEELHGAGVVVKADGTIVTASHVIRDYRAGAQASQVWVRFHSHDQVQARVVAIDQWNDLAVLKVDASQVTGLVAAPLGTAETSLVGAEVAAIGHPFGHDWTQTTGHITSLHQTVDSQINSQWRVPDAIEFDAAINQGNSGGPLFDARGRVIGIVQQIAGTSKTSSGVAFAIPSSIISRTLALSASHELIPYAWTGIDSVDLTPQLAREYKLGVDAGALVQHAYGPAAAAGIRTGSAVLEAGKQLSVGDVVIGLAGQPVTSADDLGRIAGLLTPDAPVDVVVMRGGHRQSLRLTPTTQKVTPA